jgi:hypothetical protein
MRTNSWNHTHVVRYRSVRMVQAGGARAAQEATIPQKTIGGARLLYRILRPGLTAEIYT